VVSNTTEEKGAGSWSASSAEEERQAANGFTLLSRAGSDPSPGSSWSEHDGDEKLRVERLG
jgi:hypothetical protein